MKENGIQLGSSVRDRWSGRRLFWSVIPAIVLCLTSCSEGGRSSQDDQATNTSAEEPLRQKDFLTSYLEIKDALIDTDFEKTKKLSALLAQTLGTQLEPSFEKAITGISTKMAEAGSVDQQREYFEQLSVLVLALAENGQFDGMTLYKQYCPMAFENQGAFWLSAEQEVLNPYFGDRMLRCGYVEETLNL